MSRKHPDSTRQRAVQLVAEIRETTGRHRGAIGAAARQLGIPSGTVRKWVRATPPQDQTGRDTPKPAATRFALAGLLHCVCKLPMHGGTGPAGNRVYRCPDGHHGIDAGQIERDVGRALLLYAPKAVRAHAHGCTPQDAARSARRLLHHVNMGARPGDLRLGWHPTAPTRRPPPAPTAEDPPPSTPAPPTPSAVAPATARACAQRPQPVRPPVGSKDETTEGQR